MKDYDAYLFDWDGTLAKTFDIWLKVNRKTLDDYGIEATNKEIVRHLFGRPRAGLQERGVPAEDLPEIFAEWNKIVQTELPKVELYPGVPKMLHELSRRGKKLALITASIRPNVMIALKAHNLQHIFDIIITGDQIKMPKPDPESLLLALRELHTPKDRALMLGDSEKDVRAAHNAGIDSLLYFPPMHHDFHTQEELLADKPTYHIASWQEFVGQLQ